MGAEAEPVWVETVAAYPDVPDIPVPVKDPTVYLVGSAPEVEAIDEVYRMRTAVERIARISRIDRYMIVSLALVSEEDCCSSCWFNEHYARLKASLVECRYLNPSKGFPTC